MLIDFYGPVDMKKEKQHEIIRFYFCKTKKQEPIKHDTLRASSEKQWAEFDAYMRKQYGRQA